MKHVLNLSFSILLAAVIFCLSTQAAADPAVPFPWGRAVEQAFPWDQADGEWVINPKEDSATIISVRSREDLTGRHYLIVTQLDRKSRRVLARGRVSQSDLEQTRVPVTLTSRHGRKQVITFVQYRADTGETAFVAKIDGFVSLQSTFVLHRLSGK